ncbi:uncharacterized protein V6R79_024267 [Siganus canaliculatus]
MSGHDETAATKKHEVRLTVLLKWSEAPQKYKKTLEQVLQTWAGKQHWDCKSVDVLKDGKDGKAVIVFTPASAGDKLQQLFGMELKSKDNKTTVTIMPERPEVDAQSPEDALEKVKPARESSETTQNTSLNDGMNVTERKVDGEQTRTSSVATLQHEQSLHLESSGSSSSAAFPTAAVKTDASSVPAGGLISSTPASQPHHHEQMVEQSSSSSSEAGSTRPDGKLTCSIPVGHFWYLNQIYKKKIEQIQKHNGVQMNGNVIVTFEGNQEGIEKAVSEFTALVQKYSGEATSSLFHLKDVKQEHLDDIPNVLQKFKKLLFTVSSEEILVWGPRQDLDTFKSSLKVAQKTINTRNLHEESVFKPQNTSPNIIMNISDPLLNDGLTMEQSQWTLMTSYHGGQVSKIEKKYGVYFKTSEIDQGRVKVKPCYKESEGNSSMESHASRALLKLHQRISTSVLNFTQHLGDTNPPKRRNNGDGSEQDEKQVGRAPRLFTEV